jgi:hypothetical protein
VFPFWSISLAIALLWVAMFGIDANTDIGNGIYCESCDDYFGTFIAFVTHQVRQHKIKMNSMKGSFAYMRYKEERVSQKPSKPLSFEEQQCVALADDDINFECLLCNGGGLVSKRQAIPHFIHDHADLFQTPEDVRKLRQFVVVHDGGCLKKNKPELMQLRQAFVYLASCGCDEGDDEGVAPPVNCDSVNLETVDYDELENLVTGGCEESVNLETDDGDDNAPQAAASSRNILISVKQECLDWDPGATDTKRTSWPFVNEHNVDMSPFQHWMRVMSKSEDTITSYSQGVQMWLSCVDIECDFQADMLDILIASYRQGTLADLFATRVFKETKSFQSKVHQTFESLIEHLLLECHKTDRDNERKALELMKRDLMNPLRKKNETRRRLNYQDKVDDDVERIKRLPPVDVQKSVSVEAMLMLIVLIEHFAGEVAPKRAKFVMNALMFGIHSFTSQVGRSGEWHSLLRAHAYDHIVEKVLPWLEFRHHKTRASHGAEGKWFTPACCEMIKLFLTLANKSGLYFETTDGKPVSCHSMLRAFCRILTPTYEFWQITLGRKWYETKPDEDAEISRRIVAESQQHSVGCGDKHYKRRTAEVSAYKSKFAVIGIFTTPAEFPTAAEIEQYKATTTASDILGRFARYDNKDDAEVDANADAGDGGNGNDAPDDPSEARVGGLVPNRQAPAATVMCACGLPKDSCGVCNRGWVKPSQEAVNHFFATDNHNTRVADEYYKCRCGKDLAQCGACGHGWAVQQVTHGVGTSSVDPQTPGAKRNVSTSSPGSEKKRGRTLLTDDQKTHIRRECKAFMGTDGSTPPSFFFVDLREKGIAANVFTEANSAEGMRTYYRAVNAANAD